MPLSIQKIIWMAGVVGLSGIACERPLPPIPFTCLSSSTFQSVLTQVQQHPQQTEFLQQLTDCVHNNPTRLKAIVVTLSSSSLSQVLAASPRLVASFAAIPPTSLGEATQPFLFASLQATQAAKDPQLLQTPLLGYLEAVNIVELTEKLDLSSKNQLIHWFAIAFQQPLSSEVNPLPAIYTLLSKETQAFRQQDILDRVNAFILHPKQQVLCRDLAQYLIRGWQEVNLSNHEKKTHLEAATLQLMADGYLPSSPSPNPKLDLP